MVGRLGSCVVIFLLCGACTDGQPSAARTSPAPPVDSASPASPADSAPSYTCASDADCRVSCEHGAVSADWYREAFPEGDGCEDGCTSKGSESPHCEDGICVAYYKGERDRGCTKGKTLPAP